MKLVDKQQSPTSHNQQRPESERVKSSLDYIADIFEEDTSSDCGGSEGDHQNVPEFYIMSQAAEEVDYSVPMNVEFGEQLSPNAFAKGIESMENRDSIPVPQNKLNMVKNPLGWLWIGGIQGYGTDMEMAVNCAMQELEGELSISSIFILYSQLYFSLFRCNN